MSVKPILAGIAARFDRVRTGLDVGFADAEASAAFRRLRGGVWMTVVSDDAAEAAAKAALPADTVLRLGDGGAQPFDDAQFEVVVLNGELLSQPAVREIHRVLVPAGCLFFTVADENRGQRDSTLSKIYNIFLKNGFDIVSVSRPPWWRFGLGGRTLTVCARKKNWKEHGETGRIWR